MTDRHDAAREPAAPTVVGRYVLHAAIARGGMATIHLARLLGAEGFSRTVAAKRLHPQFTEDAEFVNMFLDEARIASKIHHPNVVPVLDVIQSGTEVILVQDYVHGVPLDKLLRAAINRKQPLPLEVVAAIVGGMLGGLAAAHEARDELGEPLGIVHRDVSPQNVLVGVDGVPRLLDFGVAKASGNAHVTRAGVFKGKLAYTSPEQLRGVVTRATDIYAAAIVLWEAVAGRRLHAGLAEPELIAVVSRGEVERLTDAVDRASLPPERWQLIENVASVVERATAFEPDDRYATATEMMEALAVAAPSATAAEVSRWVKLLGKEYLEGRERVIVAEESSWRKQKLGPAELAGGVPSVRPGEGSQPSSPSSLKPSLLPAPQPTRGRWATVAALLLIAGLLAGIFVVLLRKPAEAPRVIAAVPVSAAAPVIAPPTPVIAPPTPVIAAPAPPEATPAPDAGGAASAAVPTAPRSYRAAPTPPPAAVAPAAPSPAAAAAAAPNCNPPFYFEGTKKVFKPGCL